MKQRDYSLDVIKIISCLLVVLMHTLRRYDQSVELHPFLYYLTRCSMPLFFMASGAVQLCKEKIDYRYCFKKIWNIVILMVAYYVADIIFRFVYNMEFTPSGAIVALKGAYGDYAVFWFLRTMIMIYLVLPLLHKIYTAKPILLTIVLGLSCFLLDAYNVGGILFFDHTAYIEAPVNPQYRLWVWLFYYILGGIIYKNYKRFGGATFMWCILAMITTKVAVFYMYYILHYKTNIVNGGFGYTSIFMALWVSCTMIFILKIDFSKWKNVVGICSATLLPMFALHAFIIGCYDQALFADSSSMQIVGYILIVFTTFIMSFCITRVPLLKFFYKI